MSSRAWREAEARTAVRALSDGRGQCVLSIPDLRCGGCVATIERALNARTDVASARVNLTLKQAVVTFADADTDPTSVISALTMLGYPAIPSDQHQSHDNDTDTVGRGLLRAIAVAGFGAMNIMILSVAVWSGAAGETRDTFHLISALIAVPVVAYAGQPFFRSALQALWVGRLNMDVPIAVAVVLALALSLVETMRGGEQAFFDAAVTLLFFLLSGRYLDHLMRERARSAVSGLARLSPRGAMLRQSDGSLTYVPLSAIAPGAIIAIGPDERVPVDVQIISGSTDLDRSLVTGEAMPVPAGFGDTLEAGTLNLTGAVEAEVQRSADESFLAQMMRMQSEAETGRGTYVRIADRAARLYAPVVHLLALATFVGWVLATGDWHTSAFVAISVLIITCPCALGLAVPVAHVVASGRLMRMGILMKDGSALERLADIDRVVFDKTGTLTMGTAAIGFGPDDPALRTAAKALASKSVHPAARAIAMSIAERPCQLDDATEVPGFGIAGCVGGRAVRLGRADWVADISVQAKDRASPVFAFADGPAMSFDLTETLRPGAVDAIKSFAAARIPVAMLSGDIAARANSIANQLDISDVKSGQTPADKIAVLNDLRDGGSRALMVGDGLNDAAALAAAHVSMAPASASDAGRTAADFIFLRDGLDAVPTAWRMARDTARIVRQNFALAIAYNCIAIPLAMAGLVTPLIAALAMSASSLLVIGNALRLNRAAQPRQTPAARLGGSQVPA
nr:heavy metal translocating P-type ATPase [Loktanella sp. M215]